MFSRNRAGIPVQAPRSTSARSPPTSPASLLPPGDCRGGKWQLLATQRLFLIPAPPLLVQCAGCQGLPDLLVSTLPGASESQAPAPAFTQPRDPRIRACPGPHPRAKARCL